MSKMAARNKNHASNVNKLYDEVKISEKKRLADLLQSDDDDIDLDNLIASRSSDTRRKSLDIRETVQQVEEKKLRLLKAKKAPPTFFRCIEQPSIIPQLCCSSDPSLKELYDLFKSSSIDQLESAIDKNIFTEWCSRNSRMLPNEITDAIYGLSCIRNKKCNKVALKSCKILIEMTESKATDWYPTFHHISSALKSLGFCLGNNIQRPQSGDKSTQFGDKLSIKYGSENYFYSQKSCVNRYNDDFYTTSSDHRDFSDCDDSENKDKDNNDDSTTILNSSSNKNDNYDNCNSSSSNKDSIIKNNPTKRSKPDKKKSISIVEETVLPEVSTDVSTDFSPESIRLMTAWFRLIQTVFGQCFWVRCGSRVDMTDFIQMFRLLLLACTDRTVQEHCFQESSAALNNVLQRLLEYCSKEAKDNENECRNENKIKNDFQCSGSCACSILSDLIFTIAIDADFSEVDLMYMIASITSEKSQQTKQFSIFFMEIFLTYRLSGGSILPSNSWDLPSNILTSDISRNVSVDKNLNLNLNLNLPNVTDICGSALSTATTTAVTITAGTATAATTTASKDRGSNTKYHSDSDSNSDSDSHSNSDNDKNHPNTTTTKASARDSVCTQCCREKDKKNARLFFNQILCGEYPIKNLDPESDKSDEEEDRENEIYHSDINKIGKGHQSKKGDTTILSSPVVENDITETATTTTTATTTVTATATATTTATTTVTATATATITPTATSTVTPTPTDGTVTTDQSSTTSITTTSTSQLAHSIAHSILPTQLQVAVQTEVTDPLNISNLVPDLIPDLVLGPSAPVKIAKSIRGLLLDANSMSIPESRSKIWSNTSGLYAFVSVIYFYFVISANDWDIEEGNNAKKLCLELQQKLHRVVGCTNDDVIQHLGFIDEYWTSLD